MTAKCAPPSIRAYLVADAGHATSSNPIYALAVDPVAGTRTSLCPIITWKRVTNGKAVEAGPLRAAGLRKAESPGSRDLGQCTQLVDTPAAGHPKCGEYVQ
eukprot:5600551-Pleurochrysis_carterae.AAC.2